MIDRRLDPLVPGGGVLHEHRGNFRVVGAEVPTGRPGHALGLLAGAAVQEVAGEGGEAPAARRLGDHRGRPSCALPTVLEDAPDERPVAVEGGADLLGERAVVSRLREPGDLVEAPADPGQLGEQGIGGPFRGPAERRFADEARGRLAAAAGRAP